MNANNQDERTLYNNNDSEETVKEETNSNNTERTVLENDTHSECNNSSNEESKEPKGKTKNGGLHIGEAVAGAASGILVGGLGTLFMSNKLHEDNEVGKPDVKEPEKEETEAWAEDVDVAHNVNDDMSFDEAFSAARQEVGPGGAFEWHGAVYGTYTQNEWNNMTPEEKREYSERFDWSKFESENSDVASRTEHNSTVNQNVDENDVEVISVDNTSHVNEVNNDDIEIIHSEGPGKTEDISQNTTTEENGNIVDSDEVEILGVTHDDASGANIGLVNVDGQNVAFIDVEGDGVFNYAAADVNNDGNIQEGEVVDISSQNISVSDFEAKNALGMGEEGMSYNNEDLNPTTDADLL